MVASKLILPHEVEGLTEALVALPGVGPRNASKLAIYLLTRGKDTTAKLILKNLKEGLENIKECQLCGNLTDEMICSICESTQKEDALLMVVEHVNDLVQIESAGVFAGKYLVLGGLISPVSGVGPGELRIEGLLELLRLRDVKEVVLALSSSVEGEATSMYIDDLIVRNFPQVVVTQLAKGIPTGINPEFLDNQTLRGAIAGRTELAKKV